MARCTIDQFKSAVWKRLERLYVIGLWNES